MAQPGSPLANYWVDPANGQRMIHSPNASRADEGRVAGVVFAGLDLVWLSAHLVEPGLFLTASILIADRGGNMKPSWIGSKRVGKNRSESGSKFRFTAKFGLQSTPSARTAIPMRLHGVRRALVFVANAVNREILEDQLSAGWVAMRDAQDSSAALTAVGPLSVSRLDSQSLTARCPI